MARGGNRSLTLGVGLLRDLNVAVAGAGVAGLSLAAFAARGGARVVVFDQFDAPASVGSGLIIQKTGRRVLAKLGLDDRLVASGARLHRLFGRSAPAGRVVLDVDFPKGPDGAGVGVHRALLHALLLEAARSAGAAFEFGRRVAAVEGRTLRFEKGPASARFDLVVDALGLRSPLIPPAGVLEYGALWTNVRLAPGDPFRRDALEQRYRRASKMAGVLPIGALGALTDLAAYFWSLKRAEFDAWRRRGLDPWKEEAAALWPETAPLLAQIENPDDLAFATYGHHQLKRPYGDGLVHIGDSAHAASPQLGQGANMALLDAYALFRGLDEEADAAAAIEAYCRRRRSHVALYQALSFAFTPFYQSDSRALPTFRDAVAAPVSRLPPAPAVLTAMISGGLGAPLRRLGL